MGKSIAVCSGCGGVGKTTVALSVAVGAAKRGKKTILLDASGISRSADLILGMESVITLDLADVAAGQATISSALYPVKRYDGLSVACASLYDGMSIRGLSSLVLILQSMCEVLVIDMPAGEISLGRGVLCSGDTILMVLKPDDRSLRACERLMGHISRNDAEICCVLNYTSRDLLKRGIHYSTDSVQMILDQPVIGQIPEDRSIAAGAKKGKPAIECDGSVRLPLTRMVDELLGSGMH